MSLRNSIVVYSSAQYSPAQVELLDKLFTQETDVGKVTAEYTREYHSSVYHPKVDIPNQACRLYFQLEPGLWEWPNAKDFFKIFHLVNHGDRTVRHDGDIAEIIGTKWLVNFYNAQRVNRAVWELGNFMRQMELQPLWFFAKPHNGFDRTHLDEPTVDVLANSFQITCEVL